MRYVVRRLIYGAFALWGITLLTFAILQLGGDPAVRMAGEGATQQEIDRLRSVLGLDQPLWLQYSSYVSRLAGGDLGQSMSLAPGQSVSNLLGAALPVTLTVGLGGLIMSILIGVPAGVISARYRGSLKDYSVMLFALVGLSMPIFWRALLLILLFSVALHWLPSAGLAATGSDLLTQLSYYVLSWIALGIGSAAILARLTRAGLLDVLAEEFVRTAYAKGLSDRAVVYGHALRAALLPLVTVVGIELSTILGGSALTEYIFGMPGLGFLAIRAITYQDLPVVMGVMLIIGLVVIVANLIVDLTYPLLDPRVRYR